MSKNSLVFSDELLSEYYKFTNNSDYDRDIIEKLLHYYKPIYITNLSQMERIKHIPDNAMKSQLLHNGLKNQTLEELAAKTKYKIILSTDRNDFPYVNINQDNIENNYTATFLKSESRDKAIKHIRALCKDAKKQVLVYDNYFYNDEDNVTMLIDLLPKRKLEILYRTGKFSENQIAKLKESCDSWTLKDELLIDYHDRYLLIDDKVEIILTSGFSYLSKDSKEITYVVRLIDGHNFKPRRA